MKLTTWSDDLKNLEGVFAAEAMPVDSLTDEERALRKLAFAVAAIGGLQAQSPYVDRKTTEEVAAAWPKLHSNSMRRIVAGAMCALRDLVVEREVRWNVLKRLAEQVSLKATLEGLLHAMPPRSLHELENLKRRVAEGDALTNPERAWRIVREESGYNVSRAMSIGLETGAAVREVYRMQSAAEKMRRTFPKEDLNTWSWLAVKMVMQMVDAGLEAGRWRTIPGAFADLATLNTQERNEAEL